MSNLGALLDQTIASMRTAEIDVPIPTPTSSAQPVVQFTERRQVAQIPMPLWIKLVLAIRAAAPTKEGT